MGRARETIDLRSMRSVLCLLALVTASCAGTPDTDAPFRGRTVRVIVSYGAGGGYDISARVLAEFLGRHLPGSPAIVVDNMPGAGGRLAASYLARQSVPDGLTIGLLGAAAVIPQVLDEVGVQYDIRRFNVVGAMASETDYVCVTRRDGGIDLEQWRTRQRGALIGTPGFAAAGHVQAALLASALNLPTRFVTGYRGTAEVRLALDGGEVDLLCMQLSSYRATVEPTGRYTLVLQSGEHPQLLEQGVPSATRLVHDSRGRELLEVREAFVIADRFYVAPPDTAPSVIQHLRRGFAETMADQAYLAAMRAANIDAATVPPGEFDSRLLRLLNLPREQRQAVKDLVSAGGRP